jgi:hypothetical protein
VSETAAADGLEISILEEVGQSEKFQLISSYDNIDVEEIKRELRKTWTLGP